MHRYPAYQTSHTVISIRVKIAVTHSSTGPIVKVKITITDPFLRVRLYRKRHGKYRVVRTVFEGEDPSEEAGQIRAEGQGTRQRHLQNLKKFFRIR